MVTEHTRWRQYFHRYPELEFALDKTAERLIELLSGFGLKVDSGIGGSGIVATLKAGHSDKAIGLRADMDALPISEKNTFTYKSQHEGKMHACGHDGHMTMLLAAAQQLSQTRQFDGTVYFIFQPDEERGKGAQAMIDDGLFTRFPMQAVYGMHNLPGLPAGQFSVKRGPIMAAEDAFHIAIEGKGGHSSQPHRCIDAIVVGAQIVTALQSIVSRHLPPDESTVISITEFSSNGKTNVIADRVVISGDCRSFNPDIQDAIAEQMERLAKGICAAHGADCEFRYEKRFHPTINHDDAVAAAISAAIDAAGEDRVNTECEAITASEDFSSMLKVKPGAFIFIGNGDEGSGAEGLHTAQYDFNDAIIPIGANYWQTLVEQQLRRATI